MQKSTEKKEGWKTAGERGRRGREGGGGCL